MALFPKVEFDVLVPQGAIVLGRRTDAILIVTAPEEIPRAERIAVGFRSVVARAMGGRFPIFERRFDIPLPGHLAAGTQRFPMAFELPAWLPPALSAQDLVVTHELSMRLDVRFAVAPQRVMLAVLEMAPQIGRRTPLVVRSPRDFHPTIAFEVTLASSVIVHREPLLGSLRLASGLEREFEGVKLQIVSIYGHAVLRTSHDYQVFVPLHELADGKPRSFEVPASTLTPPSFANHVLSHGLALSVVMVRGLQTPRHFDVPFEVLPCASAIEGAPLDHLRRWGMAVAVTGLVPGTGPVIAYGNIGGIRVQLRESPVSARTGIDVIFEYPDSEKDGISFAHVPLHPEEDAARVIGVAQEAIARAQSLLAEIAARPFPAALPATAATHWRQFAIAHNAFFVPSGPALHHLQFPFSILDSERVVIAAVRTLWVNDAPELQVTIDLSQISLPESVLAHIQNGLYPVPLANLQREFPTLRVSTSGDRLTLEGAVWRRDPGWSMPFIDAVIDWALTTRGERRMTGVYR